MYEVIISNKNSGSVRRKTFPNRELAERYVEEKRQKVSETNVSFRNYYVEVKRVS